MEEPRTESVNPYEAPRAEVRTRRRRVTGGAELANPWTRLVASLIDGFVLALILMPALYFMGALDSVLEGGEESFSDSLLSSAIGMVGYAAINGYLLAMRGQTLGKMIMSVKIVRLDNSLASFAQSFGLRYALIQVVYVFPIGMFFFPIDSLFIFRSDHRCIHDLIAGTKVVKA